MSRIQKAGIPVVAILTTLLMTVSPVSAENSGLANADRAVQIARQSRDLVEASSKGVQSASENLFRQFAQRTLALQKMLDTRRELEAAGFLNKNDPDGSARLAHIKKKSQV